VRGCVRVTGVGVEAVLEGCRRLEVLDVSQCKNLAGWLEGEGRKGGGLRFGSGGGWLGSGKVRWATVSRGGKLTR
jgi:F-box/leucine-rich repeat protein 7